MVPETKYKSAFYFIFFFSMCASCLFWQFPYLYRGATVMIKVCGNIKQYIMWSSVSFFWNLHLLYFLGIKCQRIFHVSVLHFFYLFTHYFTKVCRYLNFCGFIWRQFLLQNSFEGIMWFSIFKSVIYLRHTLYIYM